MNHHGKAIDEKDGYQVMDCVECGFKHLMPIPTREELNELYEQTYHAEVKNKMFEYIERDLPWWHMHYKERYELLEEMLPWYRRRLLDVGSGAGYFLKMGKERGWFAKGVEPSKMAVDYSTDIGCNIVEGFFEDFNFSHYDVLHLDMVLEHSPDPARMLEHAHKSLELGGIIVVCVPNDYNTLQHALRRESYWVVVPWHINYFDKDSLAKLMEKSGFKVIHTETTFPMELFLFMGQDYTKSEDARHKSHLMRVEMEFAMPKETRKELYKKLFEHNIGRDLIMIGKKQ